MKVNLGEIYVSTSVMSKLIDAPLPAKISFRLARLMKEMNEYLKHLDEERTKLIKKYGKENGDGNITVSEDNKEQFVNEFNDLLAEEIEINWEKMNPEDLGNTPLSVGEISKIAFLFDQ